MWTASSLSIYNRTTAGRDDGGWMYGWLAGWYHHHHIQQSTNPNPNQKSHPSNSTDIFTTFISHQLSCSSVWQTPAATLVLCGIRTCSLTHAQRGGGRCLLADIIGISQKTLSPDATLLFSSAAETTTIYKKVNLLHFWNFTTIKNRCVPGKLNWRWNYAMLQSFWRTFFTLPFSLQEKIRHANPMVFKLKVTQVCFNCFVWLNKFEKTTAA